MSDDIKEIQERIAWAESKISSLDKEIEHYISIGFRFVTRPNANGGSDYVVQNITSVPTSIRSEAGLIAHELRSTLDSLATFLALRHDKNCSTRDVYFPISKDATVFTNDGQQKIRKLSPKDQATIASLHPYGGGNNLLFALHSLDIKRKHTRLFATAHQVGGVGIHSGVITHGSFGGSGQIPEGGDIIIASLGRGSFVEMTVKVDLCFAEPNEIARRPVVTVLREFVRMVKDIVALFQIS